MEEIIQYYSIVSLGAEGSSRLATGWDARRAAGRTPPFDRRVGTRRARARAAATCGAGACTYRHGACGRRWSIAHPGRFSIGLGRVPATRHSSGRTLDVRAPNHSHRRRVIRHEWPFPVPPDSSRAKGNAFYLFPGATFFLCESEGFLACCLALQKIRIWRG